LWFFSWTDQRYEQYSKTGTLLSTMIGMTRIYGAEFAVVPEPYSITLFGIAGVLATARHFSRSSAAEGYKVAIGRGRFLLLSNAPDVP